MQNNINIEFKFVYNTLKNSCDTMLHILDIGKKFAAEKGNEAEILDAKLAPDMFNFTKQIQVFSDNVAGGVSRVVGIPKPSMPDVEKTFDELITRVQSTKSFIDTINPDTVSGIENQQIKLGWMPEGAYFEAQVYLQKFVLQNTFFHVITAYDILRAQGAKIGKQDFIGQIEMKK